MVKKHRRIEHPPGDWPAPNRILSQLPPDDLRRLLPHLKTIPLHARAVLHKQGELLRHVYFPNGGVVSLATVLANGATAEAATVGDDGLVGIEAFYSDVAVSPCESVVQIGGGTAEMLGVADFRRELATHRGLYELVARYALELHGQITRLTACNALHQLQTRCARWLLIADDHMHHHAFHLSQEALAVMLGVRRPSVSVVARTLQMAGLIRYAHGEISVVDRKGLEDASCECYHAIRTPQGR